MRKTAAKVPVILCIDVEPDPRLVNRYQPEPWIGYEQTQGYLAELRWRIESATGGAVHYNWFFRMDPQISESYGDAAWAVDRYPRFIQTIEDHGDELGVHTHEYRWLEKEQAWLHDFDNQTWVNHCVEVSLQAFARTLGRPCRSFRFGDRWLNTTTVNLLENLGVRFDLTVEPGTGPLKFPAGELVSGTPPDYYRVPRVPYTPSKRDFRAPQRNGSRNLRMIPLSSGHRRLGFRPRRYARRLLHNGFRYYKQDTPLYLWLKRKPPNTFKEMLGRALTSQSCRYLAFAIRTEIVNDAKSFAGLEEALNTLLTHPARKNFVFCTPGEAVEILEADGPVS